MRTIDADALLLHLNDYALQESPTEGVSEKFYGYQRGIYLAIQQCICAVEEAPTIDAVEVVRCKDCIDNSLNCDGTENYCLRFGYDIEPSDFCSYGERKGND